MGLLGGYDELVRETYVATRICPKVFNSLSVLAYKDLLRYLKKQNLPTHRHILEIQKLPKIIYIGPISRLLNGDRHVAGSYIDSVEYSFPEKKGNDCISGMNAEILIYFDGTTDYGRINLDRGETYEVFVHELAHFFSAHRALGLAEEPEKTQSDLYDYYVSSGRRRTSGFDSRTLCPSENERTNQLRKTTNQLNEAITEKITLKVTEKAPEDNSPYASEITALDATLTEAEIKQLEERYFTTGTPPEGHEKQYLALLTAFDEKLKEQEEEQEADLCYDPYAPISI